MKNELLTLLIFSLATASIYAVAASGLVLTYTTSGIFNFAHGAIAMVSAFVYWQLHSPAAWDLPTPVALVLTLGVFAPGFGWLIDRVLMRRLHDASPMIRIVVPIGLMVALIQGASVVWPPNEVNAKLSDFYLGDTVEIAGVAVSYHNLIVMASAVLVAVGLRVLLYRTRTGIAMRGVVESRNLTALNGADPDRLSGLAWALGSALAGLAGILIAPLLSLDQVSLTLLVVNAFAAAVVGRLRSLPLTALGAFILGLLTEVVRTYAGTWQLRAAGLDLDLSTWVTPDTVPVLMLFVALLVVPQDKASVFTQVKDRGRVPNPSLRTAAIAGLVLVAVAWIVPSLMEGNILDAVGTGLGLGIVALSLVPLTGYAGQLSLAPLAFAGLGAVVMVRVGSDGNPLALLAVAAICAIVGVVIALPALRLKGLYLALATLAFARYCELTVFTDLQAETGLDTYSPLHLGSLEASSPRAKLVVMGVAFAVLGVAITHLRRGPFGRRLQALKDSPAACSTLGLNLTLVKVQVFALSAAIAGLGGAFSAIWRGQFDRAQFSLLEGNLPGLPLVLLAVVGGIAAVAGALLGGVLLAVMPQIGATYPSIQSLMTVLPGLAGISLATNPDGAIAQTAQQVGLAWSRFRNKDSPPQESVSSRVMATLLPPVPGLVPERVGATGPVVPDDLAALDAETGLDWGRCHVAVGDE